MKYNAANHPIKSKQFVSGTKIELETCEFVKATDLIPHGWENWFWEEISNNAPFTWGDNNRSLVTAECFADHCELCDVNAHTNKKAYTKFMKLLRHLGQIYIDLEN